ncbi:hypothetical protein A2313_00755 [Candidatus Roizmanbacteria bacterium RIFOXYB2_FULL_41_10]|uniref:Uncharacterized protein n=1 Tax=Candidatus Roizmanbacteria bacterium RIFOXYA1_FULL_41_12 TaxID=1802082 RepID=A0A1F7K966_9BACT|nr:MAG: hypothetical protein A2209_03740 [Candidatus Roizmanbacteria bacterium RIFOXYA1_FULL_41_12]OGK66983.1 MAG: hypothetical protein A2377_03880 [Candidatus Roizmanbacteria bacterium RIFOXYB1_FULL_41_27]OGK67392.1 MAG: hypothetical protein A2262_03035 [Candidatus Roizmanbacteria bacterium RIFOXYA2_FULL_41_8]OGK68856.1 MAG: hypothetical protein A2313_00755 [Candidatus Roizmanbacteria bacterium RIFOXYB2_FULL_41_10]OGK72002.1 MAG: hypothetical protein A2403_03545 [Candidatus Roizmanbacteria bac
MLWLLLNSVGIVSLFFLVPPTHNLIIGLFIILLGLEFGLLFKVIKINHPVLKRLWRLYLPIVISVLLFLWWQDILNFVILSYLFVLLVFLEFLMRQLSI